MARLNQNFDATNIDPTPMFELLPAGDYPVTISDSEMKPTKDNAATGNQYLNLTLEVIDGPYKGRMLFDRLNLVNQTPKAVEIAQRQLSQICHATGVIKVEDSAQLHGIPMIARVETEAGKPKNAQQPMGEKYPDKNVVKSYKPYTSTSAAPAPVAAAPSPAATTAAAPARPAGGNPPPWAKPKA